MKGVLLCAARGVPKIIYLSAGLATTGGTVSDTGLAGLTLGGDLGWLMGKYGITSGNLLRAVEPLTNGVIVNHLGGDDVPRVANTYGSNFERSKTFKKKYDPDNFFRLNNNIKPA